MRTISPPDLAKKLAGAEPPFVLDVRSPDEFSGEGHIPGAHLVPLASLPQRLNEIPRDRPVVCVCRSGGRSQVAYELLAARGFDNVTNLSGGMVAWNLTQIR